MTARRFVLALDQGTTGSTALVIDPEGLVRARGYAELPQHYPRPGWVEHDPAQIWATTVQALDQALAAAGITPAEIAAVGITNQRETTILWERATGRPVGNAIVYFNFRGRMVCFWMIFVTLMLPVPVRLMSTYEVIGTLGWLNTYQGLTIPLMASATATFLFRQFYLTVPNEMAEAAQLDGAGPLRFLWGFLLPLSWANIAALFVVLFIFGWNQYLWPLMITNTEAMRTVVIGLEQIIPRSGTELPTWNLIMAGAMMALLPPVAIIIFMQRWFVKGLVEADK